MPGDPGSLPRLGDMAATFPLADSTRGEAKHVSQRHGDTHMHRTLTWPVTVSIRCVDMCGVVRETWRRVTSGFDRLRMAFFR